MKIDFVDIVFKLKRKHNWYLASLLQDLETLLGENSEEFQLVRKLVLDSYNDFLRVTVAIIFGNEIEGLIYR